MAFTLTLYSKPWSLCEASRYPKREYINFRKTYVFTFTSSCTSVNNSNNYIGESPTITATTSSPPTIISPSPPLIEEPKTQEPSLDILSPPNTSPIQESIPTTSDSSTDDTSLPHSEDPSADLSGDTLASTIPSLQEELANETKEDIDQEEGDALDIEVDANEENDGNDIEIENQENNEREEENEDAENDRSELDSTRVASPTTPRTDISFSTAISSHLSSTATPLSTTPRTEYSLSSETPQRPAVKPNIGNKPPNGDRVQGKEEKAGDQEEDDEDGEIDIDISLSDGSPKSETGSRALSPGGGDERESDENRVALAKHVAELEESLELVALDKVRRRKKFTNSLLRIYSFLFS